MAEMATLRELVAQVASACFSNVSVSAADIPGVMSAITMALKGADEAAETAGPETAPPKRSLEPDVIRRSITPDALISFEDGRPYKTLRRHLAARGLTPVEYRAKYGLPDDYPMVAQSTSAARSQLARKIGLGGRKGVSAAAAPQEAAETPPQEGRRPTATRSKSPRRRG
jgi:predicted transcriptional regulator